MFTYKEYCFRLILPEGDFGRQLARLHVKDLVQTKLVNINGEPKISVCSKEAKSLTWKYLGVNPEMLNMMERILVLKYKSAHSNILSGIKFWKILKINLNISDTKRETGSSNSAGKVTIERIIMMRQGLSIMDK